MIDSTLLTQWEQAAQALDWPAVLRSAAVVCVVLFALGAVLRMIFGRGSSLNSALSATLSVLLVYLTAVIISWLMPQWRASLPQLPFVTVTQNRFFLWDLHQVSKSVVYGGILRLSILAFLVNLLEAFMPHGKKIYTWYLFRMGTVLAALAGYSMATTWLEHLFPGLFDQYAQAVVLGFWAVIALAGVLKVLLSVVLTVVNPIVGAVYTFFFSNLVGKQFTKSILTTILCLAIVSIANQIGVSQFAFSDFSLVTCVPAGLLALVTLYLFGQFL